MPRTKRDCRRNFKWPSFYREECTTHIGTMKPFVWYPCTHVWIYTYHTEQKRYLHNSAAGKQCQNDQN